jgi:hypothetical protein
MKPSDTPERVRERVHLHRRLAIFKRISDTYNALPPAIRASVIDRMIAGDIADIDLVNGHIRDEFDIWEMLTEKWGISGLLRCEPHWLAKGAYEADQERIEREARLRASKDARGWKKGVWTGVRAGEPWSNRFGRDKLTPDDFAELWALNKRIIRFSPRRKLRMKDGTVKTEIIAPGSAVRRPPLSVFEAKRVFPFGKQWFRRLDWSQSNWRSKPAKVRQIYRPPADSLGIEGRYRQDYPQWAAEEGALVVSPPAWHAQKVREHCGLYLQTQELEGALHKPMSLVP